MLTTSEIQSFLGRVTYKPGWTFKYYDGVWEGPHLQITAQVPDSFNRRFVGDDWVYENTTLDVHCFLSPNDIEDERSLQSYLLYRLGRIEVHEMREFFKVDNKIVSSPHMPNADRDTERFGVWKKS